MTALALAIAHGHEDAAKMLIAPTQAAGALDVVDDTGSSALMIAATKGLVSVTEQLLAAGAKPELTEFAAFSEFLDVMPADEDVRIDVAST